MLQQLCNEFFIISKYSCKIKKHILRCKLLDANW